MLEDDRLRPLPERDIVFGNSVLQEPLGSAIGKPDTDIDIREFPALVGILSPMKPVEPRPKPVQGIAVVHLLRTRDRDLKRQSELPGDFQFEDPGQARSNNGSAETARPEVER